MSTNIPASPERNVFLETLNGQGLHAALGYLNSRTPHRFTGIYRYDQDMVRNVALFDRFDHSLTKGTDVPRTSAYCTIVGQTKEPLEILDTQGDGNIFGVRPARWYPTVAY